MAESEKIQFEVTLENGQFKISAKEITDALSNIGKGASKGGAEAASGMNTIGKALGGLQSAFKAFMAIAVVKYIVDLGKAMIEASERAHKNRIAFETLTGSSEKATKIMKDLRSFVDQTNFKLPGLQDTAKQLLAVGVSQEKLIPTLQHLADASQGSQERFETLAFSYSRAAATGMVTFRELRTLTANQVPIVGALAQTMGMTEAQVVKLAKSGKIGFKELDTAIIKMTTGTGVFAGNMARYADTFSVKMEILKRSLTPAIAKGGSFLEDSLKGFVDLMIKGAEPAGKLTTIIEAVGRALAFIAEVGNEVVIALGGLWAYINKGYYTAKLWMSEIKALNVRESQADIKASLQKANDDLKYYEEQAKKSSERMDKIFGKTKEKGFKGSGITAKPLGEGGAEESGAAAVNRIIMSSLPKDTGMKIVDDIVAGLQRITKAKEELQKLVEKGEISQSDADKAMRFITGVNSAGIIMQTAQNVIATVADTYKQLGDMQVQHLDERKKLGEAWLDYMLQQQLAEAGISQKTKSQQYEEELRELQKQYSRESSVIGRQNLKKQIQQKQQNKKEEEIREEADKRKNLWDAYMEVIKHQLMVRNFYRQQQMQMATVGMQGAMGMMTAFTAGIQTIPVPIWAGIALGAAMAAVVGALMGANLGMIAAQKPPMFAGGGYIVGSDQGTYYNGIIAGERNNTEIVANISDPIQSAKAREALGTDKPTVIINVHGHITDSRGFMRLIKDTFAANNISLRPRGAY